MSTLVHNAKIFTAEAGVDELHSAMAISSTGRVLLVGTEEQARAALNSADSSTITETDLNGRVVLPGILDAHSHISMLGGSLLKPDLIHCKSLAEIRQTLLDFHAQDPARPRLLGRAWMFDTLVDEEGKLQRPHKRFLDEWFPETPVYLDSMDLHSVWVNSVALKELGVDDDTPDPKGGYFERDANGMTGLVLETPVQTIIWPFLASQLSNAERDAAFDAAFNAYLGTGVTGAIDMAMEEDDLLALERAYLRYGNTLPIRVAAHWIISPLGTEEGRVARVAEAEHHRKRLAPLAPFLRVVGIKCIIDGVIDSCTAHMKEPFSDGSSAEPIWTVAELLPVAVAADKAGLQIALHAIGDAACTIAIDALEQAFVINGPRDDRRHRLEHLEAVSAEDVKRLANLSITASLQPVHADPHIAANWHAMLGHDERCKRAFPWSEFRDANCNIALGTDAPTAPYEAFPNMYVATTRKSALEPDMPWPPKLAQLGKFDAYCFSLREALVGATRGAAHSCHADHEVGSLGVGMSADFAVLDIDPFGAEGVDVLAKAQEAVLQTWVAGRKVFDRVAK